MTDEPKPPAPFVTDVARNVADRLADKLTDTILTRYAGDPDMTKQADPTGRPALAPQTLDEYKPRIIDQALIEVARAEGVADALRETISDLQLDRIVLTDKLIDAERDHAQQVATWQGNVEYVNQQNAQLQQMLASATQTVTDLQEQNADLHKAIDESDAGTAEQRLRASEDIEAIATDALLAHLNATEGSAVKHELPGSTVGLVARMAVELEETRARMIQLGSANEALQDAVGRHPAGRHIVIEGEDREHTEPAPIAEVQNDNVAPFTISAVDTPANPAFTPPAEFSRPVRITQDDVTDTDGG